MEIRPLDNEKHLDAVLDVLGRSLTHPGNRDWYEWKHEQNPFGSSYGFVATENNKVIGVRLFMPWEFSYQGEVVRAIRPVDTATLPEARGKGIFSKLTMFAIEELKDKYEFIFNTPNENSRPGYLKMGWRDLTRCQAVYIPIPLFAKSIGELIFIKNNGNKKFETPLDRSKMMTNASDSFCRWRYMEASTHIVTLSEGGPHGIVVEVISRKGVRILVVKEFWGETTHFFGLVKKLCLHFKTMLVLCIYEERLFSDRTFKVLRQGSRVAFRGSAEIQNRSWYFSLGDIDAKI